MPAWISRGLARRKVTAELWMRHLPPQPEPYYQFIQECHREGNFHESLLGPNTTIAAHRRIYYFALDCAKLLHAGGKESKALALLQMAKSIVPGMFVPHKGQTKVSKESIGPGQGPPKNYNPERWTQFEQKYGNFSGLTSRMR